MDGDTATAMIVNNQRISSYSSRDDRCDAGTSTCHVDACYASCCTTEPWIPDAVLIL
jgi:hypothetical protein